MYQNLVHSWFSDKSLVHAFSYPWGVREGSPGVLFSPFKVQIWPKISNVLGCLLIVLWDSQIFLGCLLIFLWDSGPPKVPFLDRFRALPPWKLPKRPKIFAARFARQFSKNVGNFHGFWASKYLFWTLFRAFPPWKLPKRSKIFAARFARQFTKFLGCLLIVLWDFEMF